MSGTWEQLTDALGRHAPALTETEAARLLPLLVGYDSRLLALVTDAYRLGYHSARGAEQERDLIESALGPDLPPTPVQVGTRLYQRPGHMPSWRVTLDLDGHRFESSAKFHSDRSAEAGRVETAAALRTRLAVTESEPYRSERAE